MTVPGTTSSAVESSSTQPPSPNWGIWNGTVPSNGLNSISTSCQRPGSCLRSGLLMDTPRVEPSSHCSSCCGPPPALNQRISSPSRQLSRRSNGCFARRAIRWRVKSRRAVSFSDNPFQSIQEISLSWQYPLLLPFCVRPNSSPASSIGVP